jgi:transposase InsO family protein
MEQRFYTTLKTERADRRDVTRQQARNCLSTTIELWYNCRHRHSSLDYLSPVA